MNYQVTASFDCNSSTQKVRVYDAVGKITYNQGGSSSPITNESVTTSGNNTKKAKATYSFTRTTDLGFSHNYSVSVACDYNGKQS